ncbi:MAG: ribosome-binding factor A, partial [Moraxella sp.]|nr:ribosome-binding factor A [Moraxella sp.]
QLSATMKTRTTPRLRFHYDEVTAHGNYMTNLVNEAMKKTGDAPTDDVENS